MAFLTDEDSNLYSIKKDNTVIISGAAINAAAMAARSPKMPCVSAHWPALANHSGPNAQEMAEAIIKDTVRPCVLGFLAAAPNNSVNKVDIAISAAN